MECGGVKALKYNEVKVKVFQNKDTLIKYRNLKNLRKYSNEVEILCYCLPLQCQEYLKADCQSE